MPKSVVIDELIVTLRVPADLADDQAEAIRRTLAGGEFMAQIRRAVRLAVRSFPELSVVRVSVSR